MTTTEATLRTLGLSSTSLEALSPGARAVIDQAIQVAARELCARDGLQDVTGVAVNLLGDATQLTAALEGGLTTTEVGQRMASVRVVPLEATLCASVVGHADGYLDLGAPEAPAPALAEKLATLSRGLLRGYAGVALEVGGVRVGTLCLYGAAPLPEATRDPREAALRRHGALLAQRLEEAARLTAENDSLRRQLRGLDTTAGGEAGVYADVQEAAAWRETVGILGDIEAAVAACRADGHGEAVAVVIELSPDRPEVALVAAADSALDRHGVRPCRVRPVGDDDLVGYWRAALAPPAPAGAGGPPGTPHAHVEPDLATAPAAARLGTAPGAFASMTAAALPSRDGRTRALRALVVLCPRPPATSVEASTRATLTVQLAGLVADAHAAALAVFAATPPDDAAPHPPEEADPALADRVRRAFGTMKLRPLLALAEARGVPGIDAAESTEELLRLIALHATHSSRARRAHLEALSVRELITLAEQGGFPGVDDAESKRELIELILDAEGLTLSGAGALASSPDGASAAGGVQYAVPARLPVPARVSRELTPEQRHRPIDDGAAWLREGAARVDAAVPSTLTAPAPGRTRPLLAPNEALRAEALERLGIADVRDWDPGERATFDGIAAGAAAVAEAMFGAVTVLDAEDQVLLGMTQRALLPDLLLGGASVMPRSATYCQYAIAKGAPLAIVDSTASPHVSATLAATFGHHPPPFDEAPISYLGVPIVTAEGVALGTVCIMDSKPRPDFADSPRLLEQLSALAAAVLNLLELRRLRAENARLHAHRRLEVAAIAPIAPESRGGTAPIDRVALLMTDIEGSTALHERDPALMKRALAVHDAVLRRAIADNGGVEVATEGDAFTVAFHGAADAIRCCFDAQLRLQAAPWPEGLEALVPPAAGGQEGPFRGCRVRMAVHFAEAGGGLLGRRAFEVSRHPVTRRPQYLGRFVEEARHFSEMASGGQVLVTEPAFDEVALTLTTALGDPRVVDLGRYADAALGELGHIYELLPRALAERRFDPPVRVPAGSRLTAAGYIHAPRALPLVVLFVLPVGATELRQRSDAAYTRGRERFTEAVRAELAARGGYEMKENDGAFMCAFADARPALEFAAGVQARVVAATSGTLRCKVGVTRGEVSVEPHGRTGRMEAFGPPCNRAARLAKAAHPGQTLADLGTVEAGARAGAALAFHDLGLHAFKGIDEPLRVVQVGEGTHPPILSLSYGHELQRFAEGSQATAARAQGSLAILDALGIDALPWTTNRVITRAEAAAIGAAARESLAAEVEASRLVFAAAAKG